MEKKGMLGLHHPSGMLLRDTVFGVNDGIVSTLALIAGLSAANMTSTVVIIAGLAESFAGAISMAIGSYISTKSKSEFMQHELRHEQSAIEKKPRQEREHLMAIYRARGITGKELETVVNTLISNKKVWGDVMQREELGFTSAILEDPWKGAAAMFFSFLFASLLPLLPFFYGMAGMFAFVSALFNGLLLLFLVGVGKTYFTRKNKVRSGVEMVIVGGIATALAYGVGYFISSFVW